MFGGFGMWIYNLNVFLGVYIGLRGLMGNSLAASVQLLRPMTSIKPQDSLLLKKLVLGFKV